MSQDYVSLSAPREPFRLLRPNLDSSQVVVVAPVTVVWASDLSTDSYDPAGGHPSAINVYDTTTSLVDTTQYTWILLAVKGQAWPMLAKEVDFSTFDSLTGGDWAILRRLAGGQLLPIPGV